MSQPTTEQVELAKKKTAAIKAYADMVYPQVLATMIHQSKDKLSNTHVVEEQRALRKGICRTAADISITAGAEFMSKWKERKGEFLSVN